MIWRATICCCYLVPFVFAQYSPTPRWGQAAAVLENILYVHGGMSDPYNSYSYTSAPEISDLLFLNLSTSFSAASPPWQLLSADSSPALVWHTLSAFNTQELLLFGGQPGPNSQTVLTTLNDSATLLSVSNRSHPSFLVEPQNWAGEPMRRMRHSASSTGGKIWIVGGEKADGSGNAFADHYVFDPSTMEFNLLPSGSDAPPDIYGHASLVLPDGRLVILGGYCASCAELVPMSTVWSLDTTQSTVNWQVLLTSGSPLPSPRRDFAAVVLSNGNILIHGGGDAQLQTIYGDGWILDTSQNPMVWQNVEVLAQLGPRRDHFAIQTGGLVLFGFGYGSSSPASASLFIYDSTASTTVSSYTAPIAGLTPTINSLPAATQTSGTGYGSGSNGNNGGTSSGSTSGNAPSSGSSGTSNPSSGSSHKSTTAIALGTTFGILGLVAGGLATAYYVKRSRDRDGSAARKFFLLGGDLEDPPGDNGSGKGTVPAVTLAGGHEGVGRGMGRLGPAALPEVLTYLGITKYSAPPPQPRKDMFADEDTRSLGWGARWAASHREASDVISVWSLRSVGAMVRGMLSREPSSSGTNVECEEWERLSHADDGDQEKLILWGQGESDPFSSLSSRRTKGREGEPLPYVDPFDDPRETEYADLNLRPEILAKDADYDRPITRNEILEDYDLPSFLPHAATLPLSVPLRKLSPSHPSSSVPSTSLPSLPESLQECSAKQDHSADDVSDSLAFRSIKPPVPRSSLSYIPQAASPPRYFSILNSQSPPSQPIRRSDSWWTRFAKTPLLDRRASVTSNKPLDFRDPTPAPRLVAITETTAMTSPSPVATATTEVQTAPAAQHERSVSSAHSGRTANTEAAERLGGSYDVVQRLVSDQTATSQRMVSEGTAEMTEHGLLAVTVRDRMEARGEGALSAVGPLQPVGSTALYSDPSSEDEGGGLASPRSAIPSGRKVMPSRKGTAVSERIEAYECIVAQERESQRPPSPKNTRKCEEIPSRSRPTIQYGLAPRAPLFIANP